MPAPKPVTVKGVTYRSISAACAAFGHSEPKIRHRMRAGLSLADALTSRDRVTNAKQHPSYCSWNAMRSRCYSVGSGGYKSHGGRGIRICDRWLNDFWAFVEDMGVRPSLAHSIDRINNDGNYEPNNCRWVTSDVQMANRRVSRLLTYNDETLCLAHWAKRLGVHPKCIAHRLAIGWPIAAALTTPSRKTGINRRNLERAERRRTKSQMQECAP